MRSDPHATLWATDWAAVTMMSVGYGDIHATTTAERTFSVVTQLVGVSMFGFLVASISSMLETLNVRTSLFQQKMDEVSQYLLSLNVPATLKTRVLSFYTYLYTHKSMFNEPVSAVPSFSMHQGVQLALTMLAWGGLVVGVAIGALHRTFWLNCLIRCAMTCCFTQGRPSSTTYPCCRDRILMSCPIW